MIRSLRLALLPHSPRAGISRTGSASAGSRLFAAVAVLCATATLAACAEPGAGEEGASPSAGDTVTLTVYTSEPETKVDEINAAFEKDNPDVNVEIYRAGTGDLSARIEAEKASGDIGADVLWAADAVTFEKYAQAGDLAPLKGVDTKQVIAQARGTETYVGTRIIPTVIAYNTEKLAEDEAPASWRDLGSEAYRDKIVMPDPAVSGAAAFNCSVWMGAPELGEDWFGALGKNAPMIAQSNGPTSQEVAGGGHPVGVVVDYLVRDLAAKGSPVAVSYPAEGAPYITEPAGIFSDSDAKEAAARYIDFLISKEGQEIAAKQNYLPVREDVATPEGADKLSDIKLLSPDLQEVVSRQEAAVSAFQQAVAAAK